MHEGLHINASNFLPQWRGTREELMPYQRILLKGYIALIPLDTNTTALLYANGCEFTDKTGKKTNIFTRIKSELTTLMQTVTISQIS